MKLWTWKEQANLNHTWLLRGVLAGSQTSESIDEGNKNGLEGDGTGNKNENGTLGITLASNFPESVTVFKHLALSFT